MNELINAKTRENVFEWGEKGREGRKKEKDDCRTDEGAIVSTSNFPINLSAAI